MSALSFPPIDAGALSSQKTMRPKTIGVFDSGVGGLTVLQAIHRRLPGESTAYLGDTARVPYGPRSPELVIRYCIDNARFLLNQDLKLLVIACNTASAVAMDVLQKMLAIPVIGVIEPGARAAAAATRNNRIGVIGTRGTVKSGAYQSAIRKQRSGMEIRACACPLFVPLAEEGWTDGHIAQLTAESYLSSFRDFGMDTLLLGCTHYPLLKGAIAQAVGGDVALVDPAQAVAAAAEELLELRGWKADPAAGTSPSRRYFVTDQPELFADVGESFLGEPIRDIERISLPEF